MSPAIREIALKAGLDIRRTYGYDVIHQKPDMFDINLFAELLIKQCMLLDDRDKIRDYFQLGDQP